MASSSQGSQQLIDLICPVPKKRSFYTRSKDGKFAGKATKEQHPEVALPLSPNSKRQRKHETDKEWKQSTKDYGGRHATSYPVQVGSDQTTTLIINDRIGTDESLFAKQSVDNWIDGGSGQAIMYDDELEDFDMLHGQQDLGQPSLSDATEFYRRSPSPTEIHHLTEDGSHISARRRDRARLAESWCRLFDDPQKIFIQAFLQAEADMYNHRIPTPTAPCSCVGNCEKQVNVSSVTLNASSATITVSFCEKCSNAATALMRHGFFSASPSLPRVAFGIDVLQFYLRASVISKAPIQAFSQAIALYYEDHGVPITQQHPYYEQLKSALPWFDALLRRVETYVNSIMDAQPVSNEYHPLPPSQSATCPASHKGEAHAYLVRQCAACFGRRNWGGDPEKCPDVIVAFDGNYQHRLYRHMHDDPRFLPADDEFGWLTTEELDDARRHIEECRASNVASKKKRRDVEVPTQVLDECEKSYTAAQEKLHGLDKSAYRSKGIMAAVCIHDVPLFLADITTLGEPRYLAVALLRKLASLLPENATIGVMYDIADQLERTILSNNAMPELSDRLSFALALFHAFGHRIQCQVVYNPRYQIGFGLANGEGNERVWSLSRDLIGPERVMGPHRRKLVLSRKMEHIANAKALSYPTYVKSMLKRMNKKWEDSLKAIKNIPSLEGCKWDRKRLLEEWELKKSHHLSAKEYSENQLTVQIRSLMEAARNTAGMTNALHRVQNELDHEEFSMTLFPERLTEIQDLRSYVVQVVELHDESLKQLEHLTERIGLSQIQVPDHISHGDQQYLKLLINLQVQKHDLWTGLQAYQDEHGPVQQASAHGGRAVQLGTTRLASASSALKQKAKVVLNAAKKFNVTVKALNHYTKPAWIPEGIIPKGLAGDELLRLEQSDELWEEVFGGAPWSDQFQDPDSASTIPAYAKSQEIRLGITAALTMDRVEEQSQRLETERIHVINTWMFHLYQAWECRQSQVIAKPWLCHRLDKTISQLLRRRPKSVDASMLWTASISQLLERLREHHPSTLCEVDFHPLPRLFSLNNEMPLVAMTGFTIDGHAAVNALAMEDDKLMTAEEALQEADDEDLALREQEYRNVYKELEQLTFAESQTSTSRLPPARQLIGQVDGRNISATDPAPLSSSYAGPLPPLSMLIDATSGRTTGQEPVFNFFNEATRATLQHPIDRVSLGTESRFFGSMVIDSNDLRTLNQGRHISPDLVPVLCHLVKQSIENSAAARMAASSMRQICSLCVSITPTTDAMALQTSVKKNADASLWLVPLQFKNQATKWGLLTFDLRTRQIQHICGGRIDEHDKKLICKVAAELGRLHDDMHCQTPSRRWGMIDLTAYGREKFPSQSVLWLCEDIKHRLLGMPVPATIANIDAVRNNLRDMIQDLPTSMTGEQIENYVFSQAVTGEEASDSCCAALQRIRAV